MRVDGLTHERLVAELGLSAEQARAVGLQTDAVVAAGAGAGKTTTLVGAVAHDLLVEGIAPQRLCVCTFTRAAAGNLISRLGAVIERFSGAGAPDLGEMWIGTIDSINARLLRENALVAGLSPGFRVADERQLRPLRLAAARACLEQLDAGQLAEIDRVLDATSDQLAVILEKAHEDARTLELGQPRSWQAEIVAPEEVIAALQELAAVVTEKQAEKLREDAAAIAAGDLAAASDFGKKWGIQERAGNAELLGAAIAARDRWRQARIDAELAGAREAIELALSIYAREYAERKRAHELMDFNDLAERAEQLARAGHSPGFARVYIDEAQDTNARQFRILRALTDGPVISIGDANQSIYGFRGADVDAFRAEVKSAGRLVELSDNYRSRPEVLEAINALCRELPELAGELIEMRPAGPKAELEPPSGPAVDAICFTAPQSKPPSAASEARTAAPQIIAAARERGVAISDVCVLCRDNGEVAAYAAAFRAIGVPALAIQKRGLFEQPEVLDVVAYLRLLADPDDEEAMIRVLSSPFLGLSDERLVEIFGQRAEHLRRLRAETGRRPKPGDEDYPPLSEHLAAEEPDFWRTLQGILAMRGRGSTAALVRRAVEAHRFDLALERLDETGTRWRNVEKLLALIAELERSETGPSPRALAARIADEQLANDEGQDMRKPEEIEAVRVMTVHQAKGDEFKLVAVTRLSRGPRSRSRRLLLDESGRIGIAVGSGKSKLQDTVHAAHEKARKAREEAEAWRVLYVALTRAEDHLLLIGAGFEPKAGPSWCAPFTQLIDPGEIPPEPGGVALLERGAARIAVRRVAAEPARVEPEARPEASEEPPAGELSLTEPELPVIAPGALSYTALTAWRRCPLRRRLEHDLGLRELAPLGDGPHTGDSGAEGEGARRFGIAIHRAIDELGFDDRADVRSALRAVGLGDDERAERMLAELLASPLAARLRTAERVRSEIEFRLPLGRHLLAGKIDTLAEAGDETLIIDWKSGDDPDEVFGSDYALQRRLYALAVLSGPQAPERVRAISYPLGGGEPTEELFEHAKLKRLRAEILAEVEAILTADPRAAASEPQPFCRGCPGLERVCRVSEAAALSAAPASPAAD